MDNLENFRKYLEGYKIKFAILDVKQSDAAKYAKEHLQTYEGKQLYDDVINKKPTKTVSKEEQMFWENKRRYLKSKKRTYIKEIISQEYDDDGEVEYLVNFQDYPSDFNLRVTKEDIDLGYLEPVRKMLKKNETN